MNGKSPQNSPTSDECEGLAVEIDRCQTPDTRKKAVPAGLSLKLQRAVRDVDSSLFFKLFLLGLIVFQRSSWFIAAHYSKSVLGEKYNSNSIVLTNEMLKLLFSSIGIVFLEKKDSSEPGKYTLRSLNLTTFQQFSYLVRKSKDLFVVAGLYFLQNALSYITVGFLDGPLYIVMNQLKVLTAALFSVLVLGRQLTGAHWRALVMLVLAELLINNEHLTEKEAIPESYTQLTIGIVLALVQVSASGLAGVLFERALKLRKGSQQGRATLEDVDSELGVDDSKIELGVFDKNFQLAFWSIIFGIVWAIGEAIFRPNTDDSPKGFYAGWSIWSVFLVLNTSLGGICMGFVFKYTNAIIKSFSVTVSIITSASAMWLFFGDRLSFVFMIGTATCIISILNYTFAPKPTIGSRSP